MSYLNSREIKDNLLLIESRLLWREYSKLLLTTRTLKSWKDFSAKTRLTELHKKLYGAALDIKELIK